MTFTVSLDKASSSGVTDNESGNDTAAAPADYTAIDGTLTIAAGSTSGQIVVAVINDGLDENNETLAIKLSDASNALICTVRQRARLWTMMAPLSR